MEIENKDSIFSDNDIYKKHIYVWWMKNGKGNIERNWPDDFFGQQLNLANSAYSFVNSAGTNWLMQVHKQPLWGTVL